VNFLFEFFLRNTIEKLEKSSRKDSPGEKKLSFCGWCWRWIRIDNVAHVFIDYEILMV